MKDGLYVGSYVGSYVGKYVGSYVGSGVGMYVGFPGIGVGRGVGSYDGYAVVGTGEGLGVGLYEGLGDGAGVGLLVGWNVGSGVGWNGRTIIDVTDDARVTEPPVVNELLPRRRRPCAVGIAVGVAVVVVWKDALGTKHEHTVFAASNETTVHVTPLNAVAVDVARPPHVGVTCMNGHSLNSTSPFFLLVALHVNGTVWPLLHFTDVDPTLLTPQSTATFW